MATTLTPFFLSLPSSILSGLEAILGHAEQHEVLGVLPVWLAELPERTAECVKTGRRHVDGAEAAVGGKVQRTVLLREPAGQRLALVTAGEKRELARVAGAHILEPAGRGFQRFVPADLGELAGAARPDALHRRAQPRWRGMRHDAGGTLAADHAAVDWVVAVAVDVADAAVLQMDPDAAAAGAHVAGGCLDLVGGRHGQRNVRFMMCHRATLHPGPKGNVHALRPASLGMLFSF